MKVLIITLLLFIIASSEAQTQKHYQTAMGKGKQAYNAKQYEKAKTHFDIAKHFCREASAIKELDSLIIECEKLSQKQPRTAALSIKMIKVEGGTFTMGCTSEQGSDCYDDEKPEHIVTLKSYYIGETQVTNAQWETVMENKITSKQSERERPKVNVSWDNVQDFIKELNKKTGKRYRLPTEAEWEYAARGGRKSHGYKYSGSNNAVDVAHIGSPQDVRGKKANELGIFDMSGNVWEWCSDWFGPYSGGQLTNPQGPRSSPSNGRVGRGGNTANQNARVSSRKSFSPGTQSKAIGFRLACD
jgi:formylglycine-generating enzyme required for sulfatase activity